MKKNTRAMGQVRPGTVKARFSKLVGLSISPSQALGHFKKNKSSHFNPVGLKTSGKLTSLKKWAYLRPSWDSLSKGRMDGPTLTTIMII